MGGMDPRRKFSVNLFSDNTNIGITNDSRVIISIEDTTGK